jgi:HK97 family phage major capsid protein/HK97 family phage prohead protease
VRGFLLEQDMEKMQRAYSVFEVKSMDGDRRTFKGWATTPAVDRMGDEIDPMGAKFKNPLALLHQHRHDSPIGTVRFSKPTAKGIEFEAEIAVIDEPGPLKDRVDTAWGEIKHGLVRGVSIGFRPLKYAFKEDGGIEFKEIEIIELSSVTIPALPEAVITQVRSMSGGPIPRDVIQTIKSIDTDLRAAPGTSEVGVSNRPGVAGHKPKVVRPSVSLKSNDKDTAMNVQDQINKFQALRDKKAADMAAIMEKSAETGETLSAEQEEQYDTLGAELEAIDKHLDRLKTHEKSLVAGARTVEGGNAERGTQARGAGVGAGSGPTIIVKRDQDEKFKGQNYTRLVIAKALARLEDTSPIAIAQRRWGQTNPTLVALVKAAVEGGSSVTGEWGAELVQANTQYTGDFIEFLYSKTVFDRLPLRQIPANVAIKGQDGAATAYWVGQSKAIPATKADFSTVNLTPLKVAALAVVSNELLRDSSPSAEMLVRDALVNASAQRVDTTFLSATAASNGVSPAGILNGVSAIASAGSDIEGVIADVKALYAAFITAKNAEGLQFVTTPSLAKALSLMQNALGNFAFPSVTAGGGSLLGDPMVTGDNVGAGDLILLKPSDIYRIGDYGIEVSISREATIEQDSEPTGATDVPTGMTGTNMTSMFQEESTAIKVVRPINFAKRRASAVAYVGDADYGNLTSS